MSRRTWFVFVALSPLTLSACFEFTRPEPPALLVTSVDDPEQAPAPTASVTLRFSGPIVPASIDDRALLLVRGAVDDATLKKLVKPTWDAALSDRVAPARVLLDEDVARLSPRQPLDAETRYTLVVTTAVEIDGAQPAMHLPRVEQRAFQTGPASTGAPVLMLRSPSPGAIDVVRNLREVVVRCSRPVLGAETGGLRLVDDETGEAVALRVEPELVDAAGASDTLHLLLDEALLPSRRYHVEAGPGLLDGQGEAPFPLDPAPGFTTGSELRAGPPSLDRISLVASSGCLVARWHTTPAADSALCLDGTCTSDDALREQHELALALGSSARQGAEPEVSIASRDESTAPAAVAAALAAPPSSPRPLRITEVLSRPLGSLTTQQFVEVENAGTAPTSLGGLELHDEAGYDVLPDETLAPGELALVVARDFVEDDGLDAVPVPGTLLVRIADTRLGGNGIRSTTGETLALREPDGRAVSLFSTVGLKLAAGQSASRVAPCDLDAAYRPTTLAVGAPSTGASATPGAP